jgi:hypothetical protein
MEEMKVTAPYEVDVVTVPAGECFQLPSSDSVWMRVSKQAERRLQRTGKSPPAWAVSLSSGNLQGFEPGVIVLRTEVFYAAARGGA